MKKLEQFYESALNDEASSTTMTTKHAANATGLQMKTTACGKKLWVVNHLVYIDEDGELVDPNESPIVWLGRFFQSSESANQSVVGRPYILHQFASIAKPELNASVLPDLIDALQSCYKRNFPACLLILGAYILCIHYEQVMDIAEQVPAAVAFGSICHGKSRACRAALSTFGVQFANFVSKISDVQSLRRASTTTLGIVIDDPTSATEISKKVMAHFERGTSESCQAIHKPRTTFITTVNQDCLKGVCEEQR